MQPFDPLQYPKDFPPTSGRKRFFMGVRGLGADLSFFSELKKAQAARNAALMGQWAEPAQSAVASRIGLIVARRSGWIGPIFLPTDSVVAVLCGPNVETFDKDLEIAQTIGEIEEELGVQPPTGFWETAATGTTRALVQALVELCPGPNNSSKPTPLRGAA